jgi:signal recognition particle receptor subunit beta
MNTPKTSLLFDKKFIVQTFHPTILVSLVIVFSTIVILFWWTKRRQHRFQHHGSSLLLCGISNSGKTQLFNCLTSNDNEQTSDSLTIHHGIMTLDYLSTDRPVKKVHVIDLPGYLHQYQHKTTVKGIIFVIDSTSIEKDIEQVSDYLYEILCDRYFRKQRLPLLIFCNKQDLDKKHHDLQSIYQLLEYQLTIKRQISSSSGNLHRNIGRLGKETFEFDDLKDIRIEFVEGSVLNIGTQSVDNQKEDIHDHRSNLLRVHQWIARIWFK